MGLDTEECYVQGMSSSLPEEVQLKFMRTIKGLEHVEIMRNAYAIEYDCCDPTQLLPTLEFKNIANLYGAGQFNGTSGYEEAAAQGLVAGINAALKIKGEPPMVLDRASSYIGTLIDDLVTKGCQDPYRMLTSRSEYRLLLRQDNADLRLTEMGYRAGLASVARYRRMCEKREQLEKGCAYLGKTWVAPSESVNALLREKGETELSASARLSDLIKRPNVHYDDLAACVPGMPELRADAREQTEIELKYEGYIDRQRAEVKKFLREEEMRLPDDLDYMTVDTLRVEARQKLNKVKPASLGQASRIPGVSPGDITVLMILMEKKRRENRA